MRNLPVPSTTFVPAGIFASRVETDSIRPSRTMTFCFSATFGEVIGDDVDVAEDDRLRERGQGEQERESEGAHARESTGSAAHARQRIANDGVRTAAPPAVAFACSPRGGAASHATSNVNPCFIATAMTLPMSSHEPAVSASSSVKKSLAPAGLVMTTNFADFERMR